MIDLYLLKGAPTEGAFDKAVPSDLWPSVRRHYVLRSGCPSRADYVIQFGQGEPTIKQHRLARNLAALIVCLPQAAPWLVERIKGGADVVLVDAALATTKRVVE